MTTPRFAVIRGDLETSRQQADGEEVFVVKDPATGRFYRFGAAERFIIEQLNGATAPEEICRKAEAEFGEELERATLDAFVESLRQRGLLETPETRAALDRRRQGRIRGTLLYLRLKAFDPDRLLDWLLPRLRFCFTPAFVMGSATLIVLAVFVLLANGDEIARDITSIFRFEAILTALIIILTSTILHEFAHGLTCKHFGGKVHEMGFLLLYFQPALYCNVSDAWLFPEKRKRLWVTFAGGYFELILWALAVITWRVSAPETLFNYAALVLIATSGIRVFFNVNPLIKMDGYYLLSDWLEIPNLRARAVGYVKARLGALWRWERGRAGEEATPRERRIYLAYGLLALVFSIWILSFIASRIGGFLVENYDGTGFVVFMGLLLIAFWQPLKRLFGRGPAGGLARNTAGMASRRTVYLLFLGGVALALVFVHTEMTVSGEFDVLPTHNADVRAQVEGLIEGIRVAEGDVVEKGQIIARLSDLDKRAELAKIEAQIRRSRADLKGLEAGPIAEELAVARQEVDTAKTRLEHARNRYEEYRHMQAERVKRARSSVEKAQEQHRFALREWKRLQPLIEKKFISQRESAKSQEEVTVRAKELDEAQADLNVTMADELAEVRQDLAVAEKEVMQAEASRGVLLAGSRPEEIEATEADVERLKAERAYIARQLELLVIRSPIAGVVTTAKPRERVGELVEKGDLILEIYDYETAVGEIFVSEKDIGEVRLGQQVTLKARAYPGRRFIGTVKAIAATAMPDQEGLNRKVVRVSTEVENSDLALKPAMTGHGKIYVGERRLIEIVSRRFVRFLKFEFWSWW